jgi:hypothetical protein
MPTDSPTLAVPGVVHVDKSVVTTGPAVGWVTPKGIREWSHELSVISRRDLTDALREELGVTMPENRIAKSRHPYAFRAASEAPLVAVVSEIAPKLVEKGVRVHTVGYDRVTGGFIYFAEGGKGEPLRVHGDLLEMIAPSLEGGSSNADIERYLHGFIDRLLQHFSKGEITESAIELANALPRLATDARGLAGVDLDAFEAEVTANAETGKKHEAGAKQLAAALTSANGKTAVAVPLFGEAKADTQPTMEIVVDGASQTLPARTRWTVSGAIREESKPVEKPVEKAAASPKPAPVTPSVSKPVVEKAASPKPAPVTPSVSKPVVEKAPVSTPKPAVVTPSPAPASAKPTPSPRINTGPGKIPNVLAAKPVEVKPVEKAPISAPRPEVAPVAVSRVASVGDAKPEAAPVSARQATRLGVGIPDALTPAPAQAKLEVVEEPKPAPVVEAKQPEPLPDQPIEREEKAEKPMGKKRAARLEREKAAAAERAAEKEKAEKAAPEPKAEAKIEKVETKKSEKPAAKAADEAPKKKVASEPAPPPPTNNTMIYVIIAILVIAAIAFFLMKKK